MGECEKNTKDKRGDRDGRSGAARAFEELHIFERARELTNAIYAASRSGLFAKDFGLADQVRRAAVSVMSNIAEGFERGSSTEFIHFLYVAKGSCGEVRAQLLVAVDQGYIAVAEHERLNESCRQLSGMISNFIGHLQRSDYRGSKFTGKQSHHLHNEHSAT
ncbi:MAG: four helix bundle protein [Planctomycetes bacterium]|nr:four helix bundle protein [Planctomycetota bacterium]MBI3835705.1 four helix bundle protein [Planctomycetota bacterium]